MAAVPIERLTVEQIASICDHNYLKRSESFVGTELAKDVGAVRAREHDYLQWLHETKELEHQPYAVCVRPEDVAFARTVLPGRPVASVVGFPDGSHYSKRAKLAETQLAGEQGAQEIDMVLNATEFKQENFMYVAKEISQVVHVAAQYDSIVKVILETAELTPLGIEQACLIAEDAGAHFVKTSTGFGEYGAKEDDVRLMRMIFSRGVKVSGGVNPDNVHSLIAAASGRVDGLVDLNPMRIRIGESGLLTKLRNNV